MRVNSINTYNYSNINNNHKQYATRPVFKQSQNTDVVPTAILDTFIESADTKKDKSSLLSKINFLKDVLFSDETTKKAQQLKEVLDSYDSTNNILYK